MNTPMNRRFGDWFTVPWSWFVAAFIYYTALAAVLLGGASPAASVVLLAYVAPLMAYSVMVAARLPAVLLAFTRAPRRAAVG